jgi:uncharacterized caspase-like protein
LIAFATAPGKVAYDGQGEHGLYTTELLKAIDTPGLKIEDVFKQVRLHVSAETDGGQVPWESSSLTGDFYFKPEIKSGSETGSLNALDAAFWGAIKSSTDLSAFETYIKTFPSGKFVSEARIKIETLKTDLTKKHTSTLAQTGAVAPVSESKPKPTAAA